MERANLEHQGIMEDDKDSATVEKRQVKPTAKAMEDILQRKIG